MYCSSRPRQPGFSFEALFPDDYFPPGNKKKGDEINLRHCLCFTRISNSQTIIWFYQTT